MKWHCRGLVEVVEKEDNLLQLKLIFDDIIENYKHAVVNLTRELASMDFADHMWKLKNHN